MEFVNIHETKTHLSKYIDKVSKNDEVIIICKAGVPVGQLTKYKEPKGIKLGLPKGKIQISDNFDDELPDEIMQDYR